MTVPFAEELVALLPRLRRFALSLTGRAGEADDLVQSACERAVRAAASWDEGTRLDAWLFRIMRNLWIDQIRRRRVTGGSEPVDDWHHVEGDDGRAVAESRLTLAQVSAAIERLPADQRAVVILVCVDGLGYREAAHELAVPIGTVMSRLSRARRALAAAIEGEPPATPFISGESR